MTYYNDETIYNFDHHFPIIPQGAVLSPSLITMSDKPVHPKDGTSGGDISTAARSQGPIVPCQC